MTASPLKVARPGGACGPGIARCPSRQCCSLQSGTCGAPISIHCGTRGCRAAPYSASDVTCPATTRLTKQPVLPIGWTVDKVEKAKNTTANSLRKDFSLDNIRVPKPDLKKQQDSCREARSAYPWRVSRSGQPLAPCARISVAQQVRAALTCLIIRQVERKHAGFFYTTVRDWPHL